MYNRETKRTKYLVILFKFSLEIETVSKIEISFTKKKKKRKKEFVRFNQGNKVVKKERKKTRSI